MCGWQLCNERGGIEADVTIARIGAERFYVTTGSGCVMLCAFLVRLLARHLLSVALQLVRLLLDGVLSFVHAPC